MLGEGFPGGAVKEALQAFGMNPHEFRRAGNAVPAGQDIGVKVETRVVPVPETVERAKGPADFAAHIQGEVLWENILLVKDGPAVCKRVRGLFKTGIVCIKRPVLPCIGSAQKNVH